MALGSPPRVREKLHLHLSVCQVSRITPACAGKTVKTTKIIRGIQDHPRVCGKNSKPPYSGLLALGSPPRVREKPEPTTPVDKEARITPACAGKT